MKVEIDLSEPEDAADKIKRCIALLDVWDDADMEIWDFIDPDPQSIEAWYLYKAYMQELERCRAGDNRIQWHE